MPVTYDSIATVSVSSNVGSITFSSIPSSYTDLRCVINYRVDSSSPEVIVRVNGSTTNYGYQYIRNNSASVNSSNTLTAWTLSRGFTDPNIYTWGAIDIFNYNGSSNKGALITGASDISTSGEVLLGYGTWTTTAITSLSFHYANFFAPGTVAALYGILKA